MTPIPEIIIVGGGGHAKVMVGVLHKLPFAILGYTDGTDRGPILGAECLGEDERLTVIRAGHPDCAAALGVGKTSASDSRLEIRRRLETLGFHLPVIVSPTAVLNEEASCGPGTFVADGAVIGCGSMFGSICILNTNSTVDHDCRLGDNVHIAPGATVSGGVTIGSNTMVGAGATIIHGVTIGQDVMIGAGATVVSDITAPGVYIGSPARRIR